MLIGHFGFSWQSSCFLSMSDIKVRAYFQYKKGGISMGNVMESLSSVSEWLESDEGMQMITEAQERSDELVTNLREETSVDIDNLDKPCNL